MPGAAAYASSQLTGMLKEHRPALTMDTVRLASCLSHWMLADDLLAAVKGWPSLPAKFFDELPSHQLQVFLRAPEEFALPWASGPRSLLAFQREAKLLEIACRHIAAHQRTHEDVVNVILALRLPFAINVFGDTLRRFGQERLLDENIFPEIGWAFHQAKTAFVSPDLIADGIDPCTFTPRPFAVKYSFWSAGSFGCFLRKSTKWKTRFETFVRGNNVRIVGLVFTKKVHTGTIKVCGIRIDWSDGTTDSAGHVDSHAELAVTIPLHSGLAVYGQGGNLLNTVAVEVFGRSGNTATAMHGPFGLSPKTTVLGAADQDVSKQPGAAYVDGVKLRVVNAPGGNRWVTGLRFKISCQPNGRAAAMLNADASEGEPVTLRSMTTNQSVLVSKLRKRLFWAAQ